MDCHRRRELARSEPLALCVVKQKNGTYTRLIITSFVQDQNRCVHVAFERSMRKVLVFYVRDP